MVRYSRFLYYDTAQFLSQLLSPLSKTANSFILDSKDFCNKIQPITNPGQLVSYDIVDLFTNIPIQDALPIIRLKVENLKPSLDTHLSTDNIMKLLESCIASTYFTWSNNIYEQIHGLPMGSPLSPIITEIYLTHLEEQALASSPVIPICWYRKVDDTFVILRQDQNPTQLLDHLNQQHPRIKFTMETETNHQLPFLDVLVQHNNQSIQTSLYRKPTHSDQYIHYQSNHPLKVKTGIISTLTRRAINISSSQKLLQTELNHLRSVFINLSGYPSTQVNKTINNILTPRPTRSQHRDSPFTIRLPYIGINSHKISKLQKSQASINTVFYSARTLKTVLSATDAPALSLPSETNVTEYSSPNIDCRSNIAPGNPSSTSYRWTGPDDHNKTGAVLDRSVSRTQAGQYTCEATNTAGLSDTAQVNINVQYPPTITSIDRNLNVTENTQLNIDCSDNITFGNPPSTSYRWTGPDAYSEIGPVLDRSVNRTQAGIYTCIATNTAGLSDTSEIDIIVFYAPSIFIPQNLNVTEDTSLTIDCSENTTPGNPADTVYKWTDSDGNKYSGHILDEKVTRNDGGQYTCTATNTAGLSDTAHVNITVQHPPTINIPGDKDIIEATSLKIDCSSNVTLGNPSAISYEWNGPDGYNSTEPVLERTVTRTQGGLYTCIATNTAGLSDIAHLNINVQFVDYPTLMISKPKVLENDSVQLVCNVTSNPTVQMTIRNLDNKTNLVDHEITNSRQYLIERAQCLHNGTYQCAADNREINRTETDLSSLTVLCPPRRDFRKLSKSALFREVGETATITVDVISNPVPAFRWWKYVDLQLEPISNYTIHNVSSNKLQSTIQITVTHLRDYGTYALKMENKVGDNILLFTLSPVSAPLPPEEISVVNVSSSTVTLQWRSNSNGGSKQTFSVDYRTENSDWNRWKSGIHDPGKGALISSQVRRLTQNTKYLLGVYSANKYGNSDKIIQEVKTTADSDSEKLNEVLYIGLPIGLGALLIISVIIIVILVVHHRRSQRKSTDTVNNKILSDSIKMEEKGNAGRPGGSDEYDGADGAWENHAYEGPHYAGIENEDTGTDKTTDGESVANCYVNQPTYINTPGTSQAHLQANSNKTDGNTACYDSTDETGQNMNMQDPTYEPVESK